MTNIHIVYNPNKGDVISRLAIALTDGTGFTISKHPDPKADINHYPLYISFAQSPFNQTRTSAWFSHYEEHIKVKQEWWRIAAMGIDIKMTTAGMYKYMLEEQYKGIVHVVRPPIDAQFVKPYSMRIGLAGYVHPAGRKGESLAWELFDHIQAEGLEWELVASGTGWGKIPHKSYSFPELHRYFASLDVLLCTSLIEGVPMPPFEALAMNKPIIIPEDVGVLNAIPFNGTDGVFRYRAGDFESMLDAVIEADEYINEKREYAATFTRKQWVDDHLRAWGLLEPAIQIRPTIYDREKSRIIEGDVIHGTGEGVSLPEISSVGGVIAKPSIFIVNEPNHGMIILDESDEDVYYSNTIAAHDRDPIEGACVVFVAYGTQAKTCVIEAIATWKTSMSEPVILVSDESLGLEDIFIYHDDTDIGARSVKTRLYDLIPDEFQYVLYLDADTQTVGDVSFFFEQLIAGYEFLICRNIKRYFSVGLHKREDNVEETDITIDLLGHEDMPLYNGGVIAFRMCENVQKFWNSWHKEWDVWAMRDQMALARAMQYNPMRILFLNQHWNTIIRDSAGYSDERITCGILHTPQVARRWSGKIFGRLDSKEAWSRVQEPKD